MAWSISDLFPTWGDSGESPPDNFQYDGGDQVNEKHLDYLWHTVNSLENEVRAALTDLDSDGDGKVDAAEQADQATSADDATNVTATYKNNDIDSDGDGVVDGADTAALVKGNDIDADGDGTVDAADDAANVTGTYKSNDIDSDGDGKVDAADDADTVGGEAPSAFADTNHDNSEHSRNFTTLSEVNNNADVPNADFADNAGDADTVDGFEGSDLDVVNDGTNNKSTTAGSLVGGGDWGVVLNENSNVEFYGGTVVNTDDGSNTGKLGGVRVTFGNGTTVTLWDSFTGAQSAVTIPRLSNVDYTEVYNEDSVGNSFELTGWWQ